jgi:hypothetical protein
MIEERDVIPRTIVVPLDGSMFAERALPVASALAERLGSQGRWEPGRAPWPTRGRARSGWLSRRRPRRRRYAPVDLAARRVAARADAGGDPSDASAGVARELATRADPWPSAATIDTSGPRDDAFAAALRALDRARADRSAVGTSSHEREPSRTSGETRRVADALADTGPCP